MVEAQLVTLSENTSAFTIHVISFILRKKVFFHVVKDVTCLSPQRLLDAEILVPKGVRKEQTGKESGSESWKAFQHRR
jgi:hypothetical protein